MHVQVPSVSDLLPTAAYYRNLYQNTITVVLCESATTSRIPSRYSPALRAANERRRVEALARRQLGAHTPSDRRSRARFTPEERPARRREVLRRNVANRNLRSDILVTDVNHTSSRPVLTSEERAT
jgi:rRNA maturation protein Nop10